MVTVTYFDAEVRMAGRWWWIVLAAATAAWAGDSGAPNIVGRWAFNERASDEPHTAWPDEAASGEEPSKKATISGHVTVEGYDGRTRYGADPAEPEPRPQSPAQKQALERARKVFLTAPSELRIEYHDPLFEVINQDGGVIALRADGDPHVDERLGAGVAVTARWNGRELSSSADLGSGVTLAQTYVRMGGDGPPRIQVTTKVKLERTGKSFVIHRIYDAR